MPKKKVARKPQRSRRKSARAAVQRPSAETQLIRRMTAPLGGTGSGHFGMPDCRFIPGDQLVPVELILRLDSELAGSREFARQQLSRPTLLIYAHDPAFACCWFSRPIDLGDEVGNPATWMLQKTGRDKWLLAIRRVSGEIASYRLTSRQRQFPITLKRERTTKDFQWPRTVTISQRG